MSIPAARRPPVPNAVLATALLVVTEVMLFGGLASGYLVLRGQAGAWPPADQPRLPVLATAFNTALLVASGLLAWHAITRAREGRDATSFRLLGGALALGTGFFILQGVEWLGLIRDGLASSAGLYSVLFCTIVGCHALHVGAGLVVLALVLRRGRRRGWTPESLDGLAAARLFWTFVVAIWPPLYALVYLW